MSDSPIRLEITDKRIANHANNFHLVVEAVKNYAGETVAHKATAQPYGLSAEGQSEAVAISALQQLLRETVVKTGAGLVKTN